MDYIAWMAARKESPSTYERRFIVASNAILCCWNGPMILPCHNQFSTIRLHVTKGRNFQDHIFCGWKFWGRVLQEKKSDPLTFNDVFFLVANYREHGSGVWFPGFGSRTQYFTLEDRIRVQQTVHQTLGRAMLKFVQRSVDTVVGVLLHGT